MKISNIFKSPVYLTLMTNMIQVNGRDYDLRKIEHRSAVFDIIKRTMEGCDDDYYEVKGDFKIG